MNISIFTEGGKGIGYGHITRCLSIYQSFKSEGICPSFIINGDISINNILEENNYILDDWINNQNNTNKIINNSDIVIIDSYKANFDFYNTISKKTKLPVYFDDIQRINYPEGIIINTAIGAENIKYNKDLKELILGINYFPLRESFCYATPIKVNKNIKSILITFGGDDIRNLTPYILKEINTIFPNIRKNVIIAKNFSNIKNIEQYSDKNTHLIFYPDDVQIKQIMINSDIAISAAGQTLYELAALGVPTIMISVIENQINNVKGWNDIGLMKYSGHFDDKNLLENTMKLINEISDFNYRKDISIKLQKTVDGKGKIRLIKKILDFYEEKIND
jgi:UDP-2,4-diacetamido-2,4,6-trideoxy-beta-L-altropyranose hydrolase